MTDYLKTQDIDNLINIANQFTLQGKVRTVKTFGSGNINDTFLVTLDSPDEKYFVLQRINTQVFRQPQLIMQNMCTFTEHVRNRLQLHPLNRRWEVPRVLFTKDNQDYCRDINGSFWRAISFIAGSQSFDTMQNIEQAKEIGYALGMFHNLISDLPPQRLADTLEGFHITPLYLQHYNEVLAKTSPCQSPEVNYCLKFVSDRQTFAHVLENAKATGKLPLRLMHGDPKINNVMFDTSTKQAVSVIDLDTVKPGLVHYDIGDCLRSGCNPAGEETEDWQKVYFDTELCQGILQGYLCVAKEFLTENDYTYIYDAIRLITFELGLRFFADYLAGNVYFKVKHPEHNLARALVQFKLTESIESQEANIRKIIQDMK
ncbi:MAG: aminoglycoside phosphotransferase family protein [Pelatocladus maniniholoensis HA4357-MV3]|jgi:Ser/Thr protein kinase RdoA (MazF antagonist)|uniref:Aminoglycoside phosphotransferase family protein n=1 Tax=Pelatocladus maniniholoensis HA4357-MV3 TaxID=1117104 RepID=A0A9E3LSY4_9NOST|nr:aminoglycoside phosphotransferase family protein [Pelatocladus maniniholoensis HA4357-MV3]BAZ66427.1 aminoglycoside phosphotransferase [Fischerella sp. NIES-4106]